MIEKLKNLSWKQFGGLVLIIIIIIAFGFGGFGGGFSTNNQNNIAKINKTNISTQEFIDHINRSNIPEQTIKENLDKNIIEELLSTLVSTTLLELEVEEFNIQITEEILSKKIRANKNFLNENGNFDRIKYEKFLLENNQSAPQFEARLKKRELQKNLFDFIGSGTISPEFLVKKLYEEENKKLEIDYIDLNNFYKKKDSFTDNDLRKFLDENKDDLRVEYLDFSYSIINPNNLIGVSEFNQSFFDKIDQIEADISNEIPFKNIISDLNLKSIKVKDFIFSSEKSNIEKKIYDLRNSEYDIFEDGDNYVLYKIEKIEQRRPDITNTQTKEEVLNLVFQKNKFDYNKELLEKIRDKKFNNNDFINMGQNNIKTTKLNSIKDNKKFDIKAVELMYSLPVNSFTLINDEMSNIYLAKIKNFQDETMENNDKINEYTNKQNSNLKNNMLKSYDLYLNSRYDVTLNQKTIERVKNFFQ